MHIKDTGHNWLFGQADSCVATRYLVLINLLGDRRLCPYLGRREFVQSGTTTRKLLKISREESTGGVPRVKPPRHYVRTL